MGSGRFFVVSRVDFEKDEIPQEKREKNVKIEFFVSTGFYENEITERKRVIFHFIR